MKSKVFKWSVPALFLGLVFFVLLALDIVLKAYTSGFIDYPITLLHLPFGIEFSLERVMNQGAMWGIFSQFSSILLVFRICVVAFLLVVLFLFTKKRLSAFFLTCVITGAVGNIADTLAYGYVIDMLHFTFSGRSYGVFNLADAYIFFGCIGLIILGFIKDKDEKKRDSSSI